VDRQSLNRDVFIRTLTAGVKFVQDFSSGFSFISPRLFGHFSLGQVSPRASKVVSWVTSDKVAFLAACVNAYLNLKGVSGDNLKEAVIALKETNFDPKTLGLQKQQLVVQVLGGMVFSSFAIMSLFKIFTERVSKNPALGFCNLVAFGTATGASLLQDRWRVAIDPKAV
jgi:hypothetical protein